MSSFIRTASGFRLIGAGCDGSADSPSQSQVIAEHADRYTIREDAVPVVMDADYDGWLVIGAMKDSSDLGYRTVIGVAGTDDGVELECYDVPWVRSPDGRPATLVLCRSDARADPECLERILSLKQMLDSKDQAKVFVGDEAENLFHAHRIETGFPWYGIDVDQSHLPQEVGREPQTISFTKGCYLGQETVARLDALGQVQKMLVPWSIDLPTEAELPAVGTKLFSGSEKPVGRLTSVATVANDDSPREVRALGYRSTNSFRTGVNGDGIVGRFEFQCDGGRVLLFKTSLK